jgi:hypothetical protein
MGGQMKPDESLAYEYLKSKGFLDILYEPDGNVPPDFMVNHKVAIEVRRLNQHFRNGAHPEPLETLNYKLIPKLINILNAVKVKEYDFSIAVFIRYNRPLKISTSLFKAFESFLTTHIGSFQNEQVYFINKNLSVRLTKLTKKWDTYYVLGGYSDFDGGGLLVSELYEGMKIAIDEKEMKLNSYFDKYEQCWLILVDYIAGTIDTIDIEQLLGAPSIETRFNRVIIVSSWVKGFSFDYK